jgi:hypothetical protein
VTLLTPLSPLVDHATVPGLEESLLAIHAAKSGDDAADVVLLLANAPFLPMLRNSLYNWARVRHLRDVLVVALSDGVCGPLHDVAPFAAVRCVQYPRAFTEGLFATGEFDVLSVVKLEVAMVVLQLGYTVLLADTDLFYFRDPLPTLREQARGHDLLVQVCVALCCCCRRRHRRSASSLLLLTTVTIIVTVWWWWWWWWW